jgi:hypothetical protein
MSQSEPKIIPETDEANPLTTSPATSESTSYSQTPRNYSYFCKFSFKILYLLFAIALIMLFFFLAMKQPKRNWEIEKSVMRPNIIESSREFLAFASKRYVNLPRSDEHALFDTFEHSLKKYGIPLFRHDYHIEGEAGWNVYGLLRSRKESSQRCFMFAFDRTNPHDLLIADAFVDQFFSRNTNIGLTVVFLGYDTRFRNYNLSLREFFRVHFSDNPPFDDCNYSRDGIALFVEKGRKSDNHIAYFPCDLIRRQRRDRLRLGVQQRLPFPDVRERLRPHQGVDFGGWSLVRTIVGPVLEQMARQNSVPEDLRKEPDSAFWVQYFLGEPPQGPLHSPPLRNGRHHPSSDSRHG